MKRWFITGTDTGVGKSVVTACLAAGATGSVCAVKPIESGVPAGQRYGNDALLISGAAGHPPLTKEVFHAPLSPHRAAKLEGRTVNLREVSRWLAAVNADTVLVEGAGGWRVPWMVELCRATRGPVIVVAANRLGVLNHTLLTVEAIQRDGFTVAAVVLNSGACEVDASHLSNRDDLVDLVDVPILDLGRIDPADAASRARRGQELWRGLS